MRPMHRLLPAGALLGASLTFCPPAAAIVGGGPAAPDDAPAIVALVTPGASARSGQFCAGTLVAPDRVLTAKHCTTGQGPVGIDVVAGRRRLSDETGGVRTGVTQILRAPGEADAAVLVLARPLPTPVLSVAGPADREADTAGTVGTIAGWGLTRADRSDDGSDVLLSGRVTIRGSQVCRDAYGRLPSGTLCAGAGRPDHCNGDSGGPLITVGDRGRRVLAGIISFGGDRCADARSPGAYVAVRALGAWLATTGVPVAPSGTPAAPSDAVRRPARARLRSVTCAATVCRLVLRVVDADDHTVVRVRVRRVRGGGRPFDRTVLAVRAGRTRWSARLGLPTGTLRLTVTPDGGSPSTTLLEVD